MYHERLDPFLEPFHFWLPGHIAGLELAIIAGVTPDCLFSRSFAISFRPGFPERFASIMHFELVRMPEFVLSCSCCQTQDCTPTTIRFVQSIIDVDHWAAHTHTHKIKILQDPELHEIDTEKCTSPSKCLQRYWDVGFCCPSQLNISSRVYPARAMDNKLENSLLSGPSKESQASPRQRNNAWHDVLEICKKGFANKMSILTQFFL